MTSTGGADERRGCPLSTGYEISGHVSESALPPGPLTFSSTEFCVGPIPLSGTGGAAFLATTVKPIAARADAGEAIERFVPTATAAYLRS
jgi:hypothetical protein